MIDRIRSIAGRVVGRHRDEPLVTAHITPTADGDRDEPVGVGLCLSGGGSRAMTAALGQLRALHHLELDGRSLLSKVSVLSTVSGGSWLGVPWTFLPDEVSDDDFLGQYVPDPGRLVHRQTEGHSEAETLDEIGEQNPGRHLGTDFSILDMLLDVVALRLVHRTPYNLMWQVLMARRLLAPYGLYAAGDREAPTSMFSRDEQTARDEIVGPNADFAGRTIHLCRSRRPLLICNTALFVDVPDGGKFQFLAPLQITPTTAGVISCPSGATSDGAPVGGGTVSAFALGSALEHVADDTVRVVQERQLALADIVGVSSAAFAEFVEDFDASTTPETPREHRKMLRRRMKIERALGDHPRHRSIWTTILDYLKSFVVHFVMGRLDTKLLVPTYRYWPVRDATPNVDVRDSRLADGGSLENTGIASMLTRTGIGSIVSCVNSPDPLEPAAHGIVNVVDGVVTEVPGTCFKVSSELPFLFGYRAYDDEVGYEKFEGTSDHDLGPERIFKHNQVFDSDDFACLLKGLAAAAERNPDDSADGDRGPITKDDLAQRPAIFRQELTTFGNSWFDVKGGRPITLVWVYLNASAQWHAELSPAVRGVVDTTAKFPNYSTEQTELSATDVNLLSHFTAWSMANDGDSETFISLFRQAAPSH